MGIAGSRNKLTKYQKINLLIIFLLGGGWCADVFGLLVFRHLTLPQTLFLPTVMGIGIPALIVFALFLLPEGVAGKYIQVAILIAQGMVYIMSLKDVHAGGETIIAIGAFLLLKYGLLDRGRWIKIGTIAGLTIGALIAGNVIHHNNFSNFLLGLILVVVVVLLFWFVFEEDLRRAQGQRDALLVQSELDRPFIEFGKNTTGLVQDLKNDLTSIASIIRNAAETGKGPVPSDTVSRTRLDHIISRLGSRLDMARYVTTASAHGDREILDLNMLITSSIYIFHIHPEYGKSIIFEFKPTSQATFLGSRAKLLTIVENMLRTCCESLSEMPPNGELPVVRIELERHGEHAVITVEDSGPGIASCFDCRSENCVDCLSSEITESVEPGDEWFWLQSVQRSVSELDGRLEIHTRPGLGTRIRVTV
ncbi:MAG TPA: ATP-binding protein [Spirochaetia bacterium]|nr:ATP-binding protein [Spirochaetia bacterium]